MRQFFSFWWLCAKQSARGCTPAANDWQWLVGFPLLAVILWLVNRWYGEGTLTLSQDTAIGALEAAFAAFVLTWICTFVVKFFGAPAKLFHAERKRADSLQISLNQSLIVPVKLQRQELVDREFLGFGALEIEWLQRMLVSGRPAGMPNAALLPLERSGLIDKDIFGNATGIKEELKVAVSRALAERHSLEHALEIIVGSSSKYREIKSNPNSATETISIGIRNSHPTRRITNCRISMRLPENVSAYAYLLLDGLTLEAQQEHLVSVAYFHEFKQKTQVPDRIRIPAQSRAGYTMRGSGPELPIEPTCISFEADSTETKPRQISCRIWLDDHRKLQLEQTT